jgi:uncharacterized membrane protein YphA (DoxX/SURF4 family)
MSIAEKVGNLGTLRLAVLIALRIAIGWHFLYEGVVKILNPNWSSAPFLVESRWIFSGVFHWMAETPAVLRAVDLLNAWGLTLIGLGLILGFLTRLAALSGAALLALYYVANPPLIGIETGMITEGNYLFVDKNTVELLALAVVAALPTGGVLGLDRYLVARRREKVSRPKAVPGPLEPAGDVIVPHSMARRELVKVLATAPILGGFFFAFLRKRGWESYEERHLMASGVDTVSSATMKTFRFSSLEDLKGRIPYGRIGDLEVSRLFLGGNLMGGWAHARDLIYVSELVKSYHTDEKVFETFGLAERCGINTILTNPVLIRVINAYWRRRGGAIQFISDCGFQGDLTTGIKMSIDGGAHACYVHGGYADGMAAEGRTDEIGEAVELMRRNGVPAGIGAHALETVQTCVAAGLEPDYWVKTLHHTGYWSASSLVEKEKWFSRWCTDPEETIAFMNDLEAPWIAFKVLAAGAIEPRDGFRYAFRNGADFICVGMYDFQIVDDVNIACEVLAEDFDRRRTWRA